jgi:hypothetical protein
MSGSSHVNLRFYGTLVHEKKSLNDPTLFLYFCNYPPFKEDLALHLNKFEFPSCNNGLYMYQVWLKLALCFILKDYFQYIHVKIISLLVASPDPWGTITSTSLNLHNFRKLSYKFELFWLSGSREKFSMTSSHCRDYLPLDENLVLHLDSFLFSSSKDDLYEV